jgi:hypothetical protein
VKLKYTLYLLLFIQSEKKAPPNPESEGGGGGTYAAIGAKEKSHEYRFFAESFLTHGHLKIN